MNSTSSEQTYITRSYNRREFLNRAIAGTGGMLLYGCNTTHQESFPNIVLIISDDQGWKDYGFMGHRTIKTPNLDKLASQSCVFTRGYVNSPLCGPSLASIITGLYPHQHKKTSNDPPSVKDQMDANTRGWPEERRQLREKVISNFIEAPRIPEKLRKQDYLSLQTGKWWMGHYSTGGFTDGMTHGYMDRGGRHGDEGLTIGRETMQPVYDFVDKAGSQPFFIWYAPFLPHTPHNPPERLRNKYRGKTDSIHIARYWANCEWFDETCGELLNYLDKKRIAENTMVLYICDNGWIQQTNSGGYAERSKRTPYEGGIRTPMMVKWPGHVTPKMDKTTLVNSIDIAPTILKACGLEPTEEMHGISLLDTRALKKREAVFGAAYTHDAVDINNPAASLKYSYVIEGEWKLILPSGRNETGTLPELYHIIEDPDEKTNLAEENTEKAEHLIRLIQKWWAKAVPDIRE
jgi:arylsulfatase A-like enzyme